MIVFGLTLQKQAKENYSADLKKHKTAKQYQTFDVVIQRSFLAFYSIKLINIKRYIIIT